MNLGQTVIAPDGRVWIVVKVIETGGVSNYELRPADGRSRNVSLTEDNLGALPPAPAE
jgi:hypothetical protein